MLTLESLTAGYGERPVLHGLCLALDSGRVHGLVGRNGSGKTTLLNVVYGFVRPHAGTLRFGPRPLQRTDVAFLPTESYFFPGITGREYLEIFRSRNPAFPVEVWNGVFELPLEDYVDTYSTGMRKKLALLGVLSLDRPVLMLDEPFNGLDLESNQLLARLLREWVQRGRTVLLTSHVLESLTGACDAVHVLEEGRIAGSYGREEFGRLEEHLLSGHVGRKLDLVRGLLSGGG